MNILFLTQFACFVVSGMLALFLILTRFQIRWPNHRYEVSRWLMCGAMLALTFHFVLQMAFDIRAKSDAIGAVVNISSMHLSNISWPIPLSISSVIAAGASG